VRARALLVAGLFSSAAFALPAFDAPGGWRVVGIAKREPTRFDVVPLDGATALRIEANASYGNFVHALPPGAVAGTLQWQWRVDVRNDAADLTRRDGDDTTLKVCALFALAIERVPFIERQLLRLARALSGEPLPAAVVCYVWDATLAPGIALDNPYSRRVRYIVARGAAAPLQRWLDERRDLARDFERVFGDESSDVPPLAAIAVGADADNTGARSVAFVRRLSHSPS
jgi:hypothetical protein